VLSRAAGVPMPEESVFDAVERLHADLEQVQQILTEKDATVRLVLTPETVVVAEARRSLTTLSLYGYRVDGVIANRVFPEGGGDAWRERWVEAQQAVLAEVRQSFADLPIWHSGYQPEEPVGVQALAGFAKAAYDADDPLAVAENGEGPMTITRTETGALLRIALPFAQRRDVDLARHGDDLVVTVGSYRRLLSLPAALSRHTVAAARVEDGSLQVRFRFEQEEQQ
jgi:arsenite-transporting ATPase